MDNFFESDISSRVNNDVIAKIIIQLKKISKLNKAYSKNFDKNGLEFIDAVLDMLGVDFEIDEIDLKRIPKIGAFITVSNNPLGSIGGLLLLKLILTQRPDFKILTDNLLHKISPLTELSIPINSEEIQTKHIEFTTQKLVAEELSAGKPIGIFPATEISNKYSFNTISDKKWKNSLVRFIKESNVPVVPVFFKSKSRIANILGGIKFSSIAKSGNREKSNLKHKPIKIRIGKPISLKEQAEFNEISTFARFLRVKTYALGTSLKVNKFYRPKFIARVSRIEEIVAPVKAEDIIPEIEKLKSKYFLFDSGEYSVMCGPSTEIPNVLSEIGRLREVTFREVGEGTNRSIDLDEFDLYYNHLVIWDNGNNKIVGSYRVGRGDEIMQKYGVKGFYLQSLFKMGKGFFPILKESIELGRSFIIKQYQRKPLSLFLLWKGILYFLLKNQQYRYLLGPASISNNFSKFSQSLIVDFFKANYFNNNLTRFIKPRKQFKIRQNPNFHKDVFIKNTSKDVKKLDKFIQDIEPDYSTPVLFKKYIQLNAMLIGFNVDPKFNNCVDGLMMLDIFDVPLNILQSLSKELEDDSILERFNF